jgi:hypothetical protein
MTGIDAAVQLLDKALAAACKVEVSDRDGRVPPEAQSVSELLSQPKVLSDSAYLKYFSSHTSALAERQVEVVKNVLGQQKTSVEQREVVTVSEEQRESHRRRALHHLREMNSQGRLSRFLL